jgi:cadmium resistance protein CadD (predicted permease)
MGATVVTLSIVDENVKTETLIRMLGIAAVALGIFALNKEDKESNDTE